MMLESDPIKPVNPYELKEGDLVKAPCHGFSGLHRCVIAKIGNGGDEVKKEFLRIIDSAEFLKLVEQYASAYFPGFHEPSNQPDKGDDVDTTTEVTANKVKKTVVEGATEKTDLGKKKTERTKAEGSETKKKKDDQEAKKKAEEQEQNVTSNSATSSSSAATSSSSSASTQSSNIPSVSTASISNTSSAESEEVISGYTVIGWDISDDITRTGRSGKCEDM
ncbi:hypothetical protein KUTeg_016221 [Tegillarca granosa]|uniref:Uncharacterized protein n=1 Tax=Tegillarca granosa TaxID=220873 RepID=A0ABQ9EK91_TEGGR|nr:hypothetical protein KUTeg_016221 [Tegillarca granosa]